MSAALLRVMGGEVAELPLVATSKDLQGLVSCLNLFFILCFILVLLSGNECTCVKKKYALFVPCFFLIICCSKQGYFQALFSCIERMLISLKIKHFMLPAAQEAEGIWMNKFGFTKIPQEQVCVNLHSF